MTPALITVGLALGGATLTVVLAVAVPPVTGESEAAGVIAATLLAAWAATTRRSELALAVLLAYLALVDGYVRLRTGDKSTTLIRDLLLYSLAGGVAVRWLVRREDGSLPPLTGWVVAWSAVVLVQLLNPHNGTVAHSLASVRQHVEWVPLFFLGYLVIRTTSRLRWFLLLLLLVSAVNGVVTAVQFGLSPEELASWGPGYEERIYGTGDVSGRTFVDESGVVRTRPFGLGADFGFSGFLGILAGPAVVAVIILGRNRRLYAAVALLLAAGIALGVATSQARTGVVGTFISLGCFVLAASSARRAVAAFGGLVIAGALAAVLVVAFAGRSEEGSFDRYESISPRVVLETTYDYRRDTLAVLPQYAKRYPFGAGIGSVGPAAGYRGAPPNRDLDAESQFNFLLIEVGLIGAVVFLVFHLRLLGGALARVRTVPDKELRLMLTALVAPLAALFLTGIVGTYSATSPLAPYFWFVAGVLAYWLWGRSHARTPEARSAEL